MLFDLRERIRVQSKLPDLPRLAPRDGAAAGGRPVLLRRLRRRRAHRPGGRTLEVVLTDVSGKGMDAGSRALLLSGAFGGLLGSLPPHAFLPAANGYLLRQDWDEGFATSVHLVLDLDTGDYELLSAGHPPAPPAHAGQRPWEEKAAEGPCSGCTTAPSSTRSKGSLRPATP